MHKGAFDALETCLNDLHLQAAAVIDDHWQHVMAMDKKAKSWDEKSVLQLVSHRSGNSLQLKWIGIKWTGGSSARRILKINIPRSSSELTYSMVKLRKWCRDWEYPIVEESERKLTLIRKQAYFVVRAIMALRNAQAIALKHPLVETESSPGDD